MALVLIAGGGAGAQGLPPLQASSPVAANPLGRNSVKPVVQHVFSQALEAPAWVDAEHVLRAQLYNDELSELSAEPQPRAAFGAPNSALFEVVRTPEPPVPWDEATAVVAFRFEPGMEPPGPDTVGRLLLPARRRTALVVPVDAVLSRDDGPYVLVRGASEDGVEKRPVTLGKVQYDMATITAGLRAHDPVVVRNAFLLDAEQRFRGASARMP
jgi:hypothetical protein